MSRTTRRVLEYLWNKWSFENLTCFFFFFFFVLVFLLSFLVMHHDVGVIE